MNTSVKKSMRKTTKPQFQKLVALMMENPHLAKGIIPCGAKKLEMDNSWKMMCKKINALGPPERSVTEWKKIWADMKFRTKKTISENKYWLEEGGNYHERIRDLTPLELKIAKIIKPKQTTNEQVQVCHVEKPPVVEIHATEKTMEIPVISKTSLICETGDPYASAPAPHDSVVPEEFEQTLINSVPAGSESNVNTTTPAIKTYHSLRKKHVKIKRKAQQREEKTEPKPKRSEEMKLLEQQLDMQQSMIDALRMQAESAEASAEALQDIAESTKIMAKAMMAVAKHFTKKDLGNEGGGSCSE